jgi:hypothetical protein
LALAFLFLAQKGEGDFEAACFFLGDKEKAIWLIYKNYNKTNYSPGILTQVMNENRATWASIHGDPPASFTSPLQGFYFWGNFFWWGRDFPYWYRLAGCFLGKVLQMLGTQLFKVLGGLLRQAKRFTLGFIVISDRNYLPK